jgi:phage terminase small subunit
MADNETQLTDKQRRFVDAYLNETDFNGTKAAEIAGYSKPRQSASENLSNPTIRKEIDHYFDSLKNEGLRNKNVRVDRLRRMVDAYEMAIVGNAKEAQEAMDRGERVPVAALNGFYERTVKISANGKTVTAWEFNKALDSAYKQALDQIAKELGDYTQKTELTGKDGGPLAISVADDAYESLMSDIEEGIL